MTREEAINEIKSWAISSKTGREVLETLIPELAESDDERIRKKIVGCLRLRKEEGKEFFGSEPIDNCIAYLEKQKDASKAIEAVDRIDKYIDENVANAHDMKDSNPDKQYYRGWDDALAEMSGILQDVYSVEKKKESLRDFIDDFPYSDKKEQNSTESEDERIGNVIYCIVRDNKEVKRILDGNGISVDNALAYLEKQKDLDKMIVVSPEVWDKAIADAYENGKKDGEKKKEQKEIPLMGGDTDTYFDDLRITTKPLTSREWFDEGIKYAQRLQKEQKPILEVFGFKVGDAVRLKDGDGRKHIIKSFEEIEGVHGPNFYHVEFEDNSARDCIYPGEEYPNGYYTQMERFEEEQKPVVTHGETYHVDTLGTQQVISGKMPQKPTEWSAKGRRGRIGSTPEHIRKKAENFLSKMEPPYDADDICSAYETGAMENANYSWSEEDEKMLAEAAKVAMQGILASGADGWSLTLAEGYKPEEKHSYPIGIARFAIACADELIKQMKEEKK